MITLAENNIVEKGLILNLTQHKATPEQLEAGVVDPSNHDILKDVLTFNQIPSKQEMQERAEWCAQCCHYHGVYTALIGGAPFFMSTLEKVLIDNEIQPVYAFSVRQSVDNPDGTKTSVFKHAGFVEV